MLQPVIKPFPHNGSSLLDTVLPVVRPQLGGPVLPSIRLLLPDIKSAYFHIPGVGLGTRNFIELQVYDGLHLEICLHLSELRHVLLLVDLIFLIIKSRQFLGALLKTEFPDHQQLFHVLLHYFKLFCHPEVSLH